MARIHTALVSKTGKIIDPDYLQRLTVLRHTAALALVVHDLFRLSRAERPSCKKHTREGQNC